MDSGPFPMGRSRIFVVDESPPKLFISLNAALQYFESSNNKGSQLLGFVQNMLGDELVYSSKYIVRKKDMEKDEVVRVSNQRHDSVNPFGPSEFSVIDQVHPKLKELFMWDDDDNISGVIHSQKFPPLVKEELAKLVEEHWEKIPARMRARLSMWYEWNSWVSFSKKDSDE